MAKTRARLFLSGRRSVAGSALLLGLMFASASGWAQYFQFSQFNFTPQRINPASVASSNDAHLALVYRNQGTDGGFRLSSNSLNAMYPIQSRQGNRWSGVGVSFLDDRSGKAGIFVTQEVGLAYAVNIQLSRNQSLSLGTRAIYQGRRINLAGLYTGSQYIPDRGFDESLSPGENFGELRSDYFTFSLGLHWQQEDKKGSVVGYWDVSFFDLNRPEEHFITVSALNPTFVAGGGVRVFRGRNISVFPQVLYTRSAANNVLNAGVIFRHDLPPAQGQKMQYIDVMTAYIVGRSGVLGLQFHNERFGVGVSYDFPLFYRNVANTGAVEVGVVLKKEVIRNRKRSTKDGKEKTSEDRASGQQRSKQLAASVGVKKPKPSIAKSDTTLKDNQPSSGPSMSERLRLKQDSIAAQGIAGIIQHDPLILEKATLRFNFEFNSSEPGEDAREYLSNLVSALKDNPELKLKLVGHTDNVGSDKFNLRLSVDRAQAIKEYVIQQGIDASRVSVDGKGMREPLNDNGTPEQQAMNRRVEMTILYDH